MNYNLAVRKGLASKSTLHTSGFVINQAPDDHTNLGGKDDRVNKLGLVFTTASYLICNHCIFSRLGTFRTKGAAKEDCIRAETDEIETEGSLAKPVGAAGLRKEEKLAIADIEDEFLIDEFSFEYAPCQSNSHEQALDK